MASKNGHVEASTSKPQAASAPAGSIPDVMPGGKEGELPPLPAGQPDGYTIAQEQRYRSQQIEAAGCGNYPPDERVDVAPAKQVAGVAPAKR